MIGPGEAFGELALLSPGSRRSATVESLDDGETLSVYRDDFALLQSEHPGVKDVLLRLLAEQLARASDRIVEAHYTDAETRVRRRLHLANPSGQPAVSTTQEHLAEMAGTSRATVSQVLREERRGTVALSRGYDRGGSRLSPLLAGDELGCPRKVRTPPSARSITRTVGG